MSGKIPYSWYRRELDRYNQGLDNPMGVISEEEWNNTPTGDQVRAFGAYNMGFQMGEDADGVRQRFTAAMGNPGNYGAGFRIIDPETGNWDSGYDESFWRQNAVDPNRIFKDPVTGLSYAEVENMTPESQHREAQSVRRGQLGMLAAFTAMAGGAQLAGLGSSGGGAAAGGGNSFLSGIGDSISNWAGGVGDSISNFASGVGDSISGMFGGGTGWTPSSTGLMVPTSEAAALGGTTMPTIGSMGGNLLRSGLGDIIGAGIDLYTGRNNSQNIGQAAQADREFAREMWGRNLQASRPNQQNAMGDTRQWTMDENGNWTQTDRFSAPRQQQYDTYQNIANQRMNQASQINLGNPNIDWNALGFGAQAAALGLQPGGTTGRRPQWSTESPYTNLGGRGLGPNTNPNQDMNAFQGGITGTVPQVAVGKDQMKLSPVTNSFLGFGG